MKSVRMLVSLVMLSGLLVAVGQTAATGAPAAAVPRFSHIVVVMMENHSSANIAGNTSAPYINSLMKSGANFTNSYAVTHPSQPNYLTLFSGSTQGVTSDNCPNTFSGANLGSELRSHSLSFTGYSESLPSVGFTGCTSGLYARKHSPWVNFTNLPASVNQPFTAFPKSYGSLPTVSFVIPNLDHDMHNGTIAQGDSWLKSNLSGYLAWAKTNNSLLILTWDEDDYGDNNKIPTVMLGAHVKTSAFGEYVTHNRVLRTIEAAYGLPVLAAAAYYQPFSDTWN